MMVSENGWTEHKLLILSKLDDLKVSIDGVGSEVNKLRNMNEKAHKELREEIDCVNERVWSTKIKVAGFTGGIFVAVWIIATLVS